MCRTRSSHDTVSSLSAYPLACRTHAFPRQPPWLSPRGDTARNPCPPPPPPAPSAPFPPDPRGTLAARFPIGVSKTTSRESRKPVFTRVVFCRWYTRARQRRGNHRPASAHTSPELFGARCFSQRVTYTRDCPARAHAYVRGVLGYSRGGSLFEEKRNGPHGYAIAVGSSYIVRFRESIWRVVSVRAVLCHVRVTRWVTVRNQLIV